MPEQSLISLIISLNTPAQYRRTASEKNWDSVRQNTIA